MLQLWSECEGQIKLDGNDFHMYVVLAQREYNCSHSWTFSPICEILEVLYLQKLPTLQRLNVLFFSRALTDTFLKQILEGEHSAWKEVPSA